MLKPLIQQHLPVSARRYVVVYEQIEQSTATQREPVLESLTPAAL